MNRKFYWCFSLKLIKKKKEKKKKKKEKKKKINKGYFCLLGLHFETVSAR